MPFARIDDKDTVFYYTDSGIPPNVPDYTTIVLIHGATINGGIFEGMLPHAAKHGLRLLALNMRGYNGSTPYTAEELAAFTDEDLAVQTNALRGFGREFAGFLVYVCTVLGIPPTAVHAGETRGGLAVLTWSLSTAGLFAMLGDPATLTPAQHTALAPYLHTAFAFDPPACMYGVWPDIGLGSPLDDPAVPPADKAAAFGAWVSGYYTAVRAVGDITPEGLRARTDEEGRPPTLHTLAGDAAARIVEPDNLEASVAFLGVAPSVYAANFARGLGDADAALPRVRVVALWCERSIWLALWAAKEFAERVKDGPVPGGRLREAALVQIEGANHCFQWDEPERLVRILRANV
ncbi:alpha/beta hydrolase [Phanerochaete sordida]|uniref:Alpha/beta hydrolase n=1 Tax=Phanerochaete sordida TaxID=48140 RepID=A0A9P3GBA0_9APHY|nr:alpha/beta hydrolase [Phanerochaete sordida]